MSKEASLVLWYGLSSGRSKLIGGLPEATYKLVAPMTTHVFPTSRQVALDAQRLIAPFGATLVMHGQEFGLERFGIGAKASVQRQSVVDEPLDLSNPGFKRDWCEVILSAARVLNWPAGPMQWWAAVLQTEEYSV